MKWNLIIWVLIAVILASCTRPEPEIEVTSVTISQPGAEMVEGESLQLTALVQPTGAKDKLVVWASSKTSVAVVSQDGLVQALREGSSKITATSVNGKVGSCAVTVSRKVVAVQSVAFEKTALSLVEGDTEALSVSISPADATETDVAWSSSNENVVTVNDYGVITAVGAGEAVVKAMVGGIPASCRVTVAQKVIPVSAIEISSPSLNIVLGTAEALSVTVLPTDATDKSVTWASVNPAIATVDQTGIVSAKTVGTTTITATTTDGGFVAACEVTVYIPYVAVTSVTLDKSTATLEKGKTLNLTATVLPENASVKSVSWSSGNTNVANVDQAGKVNAVGCGTATITAKCGDCSATCTVTVVVPVTGVSLNNNVLTMTEGESVKLVASIVPADATDQALSWSSSNPAIASVDASGRVSALKEGAAIITVTTQDGNKVATCSVTVKAAFVPVTSVTLDKSSLKLNVGESNYLNPTVIPSNATNKTVSWSSSDNSVATVDDSGRVTAANEGTVTITARAENCTATCVITVIVPVAGISLNKDELILDEGDSETLIATIYPENASNKTVTWNSSNIDVAIVDEHGKVTATGKGNATVTVVSGDISASCRVTVIQKPVMVAVDMGLSVKWATCNVGAYAPEESGSHYAWGEIETKGYYYYTWSSYRFNVGGSSYADVILSKYNTYAPHGYVDDITLLEPSDDVAFSSWGDGWRMPTREELSELINSSNCTKEWVNQNGVKGMLLTSKINGNSIFLPGAGYILNGRMYSSSQGYYWSSNLDKVATMSAQGLEFYSGYAKVGPHERLCGYTVRPVRKEE